MELGKLIKWVDGIGMYAFDLPRITCRFRTAFCNLNCYNQKFYRMYPRMIAYDKACLEAWESCTLSDWILALERKRKSLARFRWATRGDICYSEKSITQVALIARHFRHTIFWIPTRSWRVPAMWAFARGAFCDLDNIRLMASVDPSNTPEEINGLEKAGISTLFFGNNSEIAQAGRIQCPKTWGHIEGSCGSCNHCFGTEQIHIHLKKH